jgi:hypothetical protein
MILEDWLKLLCLKMKENGEENETVESMASSPERLTAWTKNTVYYTDFYDGDAYISSVPRHPSKGK